MQKIVLAFLILLLSFSSLAQTVDYRSGATSQVVQVNQGDDLVMFLSNFTRLKAQATNNTNLTINSIKSQDFSPNPQTTWNQTTLNSVALQSFLIDIQENNLVTLELQTDVFLLSTNSLLYSSINWYSKKQNGWEKTSFVGDVSPVNYQDKNYVLAGYNPIVNTIIQQPSLSCPSIDPSKFNITVVAPNTTFPEFPTSILCSDLPETVKLDIVSRLTQNVQNLPLNGKVESLAIKQEDLFNKLEDLQTKTDKIINNTSPPKDIPSRVPQNLKFILFVVLFVVLLLVLGIYISLGKKGKKISGLPYLRR